MRSSSSNDSFFASFLGAETLSVGSSSMSMRSRSSSRSPFFGAGAAAAGFAALEGFFAADGFFFPPFLSSTPSSRLARSEGFSSTNSAPCVASGRWGAPTGTETLVLHFGHLTFEPGSKSNTLSFARQSPQKMIRRPCLFCSSTSCLGVRSPRWKRMVSMEVDLPIFSTFFCSARHSLMRVSVTYFAATASFAKSRSFLLGIGRPHGTRKGGMVATDAPVVNPATDAGILARPRRMV